MDTRSTSSLYEGSDIILEYCCSTCEEGGKKIEAECYCAKCDKLYCDKCIPLHKQLFTAHEVHGKGELSVWPLGQKARSILEKCKRHKDEKVNFFCANHNQLCCSTCLVSHRKCVHVSEIKDVVATQPINVQQLLCNIQMLLEQLRSVHQNINCSIQNIQDSYNEQANKIKTVRQKINCALDKLEAASMKELNDQMASLKAASYNIDDKCTHLQSELIIIRDMIQDVGDGDERKELAFIACQKGLEKIEQSELYLTYNSVKTESYFKFDLNTEIEQYLSELSSLGRVETKQTNSTQSTANQVITKTEITQVRVLTTTDSSQSYDIRGVCSLPNGQIIVSDYENKRIVLLDQQYEMFNHYDLAAFPKDMCFITPHIFAVAVDCDNLHKVLFLSVTNRKLDQVSQIELQHSSTGLAHYLGNLFVASGTALYQYTLTGTQIKELYVNHSNTHTVYKCALSPSGDKIYVTDLSNHTILTLDRDGKLLRSFSHPELQGPSGIHVTNVGQLFACGWGSNIVIQLDTEGKKMLDILATPSDGVRFPFSLNYNCETDTIHVVQRGNKNMLVIKLTCK
ncbi:uncharacterized protein LOC127854942 [Dreissena polymorpha]|uniref:uncharacterized protein LOC127854942 n=1 Tax=Dreissena polymorpha TaxID=45954 RepID=UPI002265451C|nr:uncharacterized protein LOC127854942 [Dreissena polymorpha]